MAFNFTAAEIEQSRKVAAELVAKLNRECPELKAAEDRAMRRYAARLVAKEG